MIAHAEPIRAPAIATQRPKVLLGRSVDGWVLTAGLVLLGLGLVMVFDAGFFVGQERFGSPYALVRRHLVFMAVAVLLGGLFLRVDPRRLERIAYPVTFAAVFLVAVTLLPGL